MTESLLRNHFDLDPLDPTPIWFHDASGRLKIRLKQQVDRTISVPIDYSLFCRSYFLFRQQKLPAVGEIGPPILLKIQIWQRSCSLQIGTTVSRTIRSQRGRPTCSIRISQNG